MRCLDIDTPRNGSWVEERGIRPYQSNGPLDEILGGAERLGYLKADQATGPLVEAYRAWCHEHQRPMVLLHHHQLVSSIFYTMPDLARVLRPETVKRLRHRIAPALRAGRLPNRSVCRCGGRIVGLRPELAEGVAFWIADAALDDDQTGPLQL